MQVKIGLSSSEFGNETHLSRLIVDFWNGIQTSDDLDAAVKEVLSTYEVRVTDALYGSGRDVAKATSLTFEAMHIIEELAAQE